jgi:hypothetical protein
VDANGAIGGHPVKVIVEDSKNDPGTAQSVIQDLFQNQHVVATDRRLHGGCVAQRPTSLLTTFP